MATREDLERWQRSLRAAFPIVGGMRRRRAVAALAGRLDDPDVIPLLIEAAGSRDADVAARALTALRGLQAQPVIDTLCARWADNRDDRLGAIVAERGYVASQPLEVEVLTTLKCGARLAPERVEVVSPLIAALKDRDETIRSRARATLEGLPSGPARDALCDAAVKDPAGLAARLCIEKGMRPSDPERACMFLFVTRQLDAYFREDFEFQNLRLEYERADAAVRAHVMEVVRSGDRRCLGFIGTRKALTECSEAELKPAIESWLRHQDWPRLFRGFLELPLKFGLPVLEHLRKSGWQPEEPELLSLYRQTLADTDGQLAHAQKPRAKGGDSVFERWLAQERKGESAGANEATLLQRLQTATPVEGVAIVAALAAKAAPGGAAAQAVQASPHWLVRLAGHATGLCHAQADQNYWVNELTSASALECWPGRATPADLEALESAPPEAWLGMLGAARKVLRALMGYRITTGSFEQMMVEADESAGEFELAE
ncbi:MAG: HEAT repeat domain-containing protein [Deltaproteobacteria bacterium]|nr:HEAT repeat domain-containing protein [Deltaproteobacteria bacterium]